MDGLLDIMSRHDVGSVASGYRECLSYVFDIGMEKVGAILFEVYWPQFDFTWFSEVNEVRCATRLWLCHCTISRRANLSP